MRGGLNTTPVSLVAYDLSKQLTRGIIIGLNTEIANDEADKGLEWTNRCQKTKADTVPIDKVQKYRATLEIDRGVYRDHFQQERHF